MNKFEIKKNQYLNKDIQGFYHTHYLRYKQPGNPDFLNDLKNTFNDYSNQKLEKFQDKEVVKDHNRTEHEKRVKEILGN